MGIEPTYPAWKAGVLPLNYTRMYNILLCQLIDRWYIITFILWCQHFFYYKCPVPESNQRHEDFQSSALPTELTGQRVAGTGFEPMTFGLWARRASRLLHPAILYFYYMSVLKFYTWILKQWAEVDSNHRSNLQQIYSLSPLATRESIHILSKHPHALTR